MSLKPFPADPSLPQLKIASDPELMREVFRRHLRPLTRKAYHIQDCLLSRVRRQEPRWPDTIAAMVKEARDSLANRVW